jgi:5'-phosphate synthase pdxT subunit
LKVGVLGLQGDVREHVASLEAADATPVVVKRASELADVDALILPGGESTTIGKLLDRFELLDPLRRRVSSGMPVYGTCAGMILLADRVEGRDPAPHRIGGLDIEVVRNAYGRQSDSFEADLAVAGLDEPFRAVFIRAPGVNGVGEGVEVLAEVDGAPVLVRQGRVLASSFHPEMTGDARIHEMFVDIVNSTSKSKRGE